MLTDYYITSFILKHDKEVHDTLPTSNIPIDKFRNLHEILCIFKAIIRIFESSKTLFSSAFTNLEKAINALYQLHYVNKNPFAYYFATSLEQYTLKSDDGGLWNLAYTFTPDGRADFRKRNIQGFAIENKNWLQYFNLTEDVDANNDEQIIFSEDEEIIISIKDSDNDSDSDSDDDLYEDDDSDSQDDDEYYVHLNVNFTDHLQSAKKKLKELLTNYNLYIETSGEIFSFLKTSKNDYSWVQIRNSIQGWKDIGDIALRLLCTCCSEASCERTIKRQRYVLDSKRLRTTDQLLDARMILNSL